MELCDCLMRTKKGSDGEGKIKVHSGFWLQWMGDDSSVSCSQRSGPYWTILNHASSHWAHCLASLLEKTWAVLCSFPIICFSNLTPFLPSLGKNAKEAFLIFLSLRRDRSREEFYGRIEKTSTFVAYKEETNQEARIKRARESGNNWRADSRRWQEKRRTGEQVSL